MPARAAIRRATFISQPGCEMRDRGFMRLDKYLKVSRLIKRRTVANEACDNGRVTLNGRVARASTEVNPGDIIGISFGDRTTQVEVLAVQETVHKESAKDLFRYV